MQITLNKVPFDVGQVEEGLRRALLLQPEVAAARSRRVAAVDAAGRRTLLGQSPDGRGLLVSPGLTVFVPRAGERAAPGTPPRRADAPTRHMAERLRDAVGAKDLGQIVGALVKVLGVPRLDVPPFKALEGRGPYLVRLHLDYAVVSLANASRNLTAYAFVPAAAGFTHSWGTLDAQGAEGAAEAPEGAPAAGTLQQLVLLTPGAPAAAAIRRMALNRRLRDLQADLGGVAPADLDPSDPRRGLAARLGAEARLLQPRPGAPSAATPATATSA